MNELNRRINREVRHRLAAGLRPLPLAHRGELEVFEKLPAFIERSFHLGVQYSVHNHASLRFPSVTLITGSCDVNGSQLP